MSGPNPKKQKSGTKARAGDLQTRIDMLFAPASLTTTSAPLTAASGVVTLTLATASGLTPVQTLLKKVVQKGGIWEASEEIYELIKGPTGNNSGVTGSTHALVIPCFATRTKNLNVILAKLEKVPLSRLTFSSTAPVERGQPDFAALAHVYCEPTRKAFEEEPQNRLCSALVGASVAELKNVALRISASMMFATVKKVTFQKLADWVQNQGENRDDSRMKSQATKASEHEQSILTQMTIDKSLDPTKCDEELRKDAEKKVKVDGLSSLSRNAQHAAARGELIKAYGELHVEGNKIAATLVDGLVAARLQLADANYTAEALSSHMRVVMQSVLQPVLPFLVKLGELKHRFASHCDGGLGGRAEGDLHDLIAIAKKYTKLLGDGAAPPALVSIEALETETLKMQKLLLEARIALFQSEYYNSKIYRNANAQTGLVAFAVASVMSISAKDYDSLLESKAAPVVLHCVNRQRMFAMPIEESESRLEVIGFQREVFMAAFPGINKEDITVAFNNAPSFAGAKQSLAELLTKRGIQLTKHRDGAKECPDRSAAGQHLIQSGHAEQLATYEHLDKEATKMQLKCFPVPSTPASSSASGSADTAPSGSASSSTTGASTASSSGVSEGDSLPVLPVVDSPCGSPGGGTRSIMILNMPCCSQCRIGLPELNGAFDAAMILIAMHGPLWNVFEVRDGVFRCISNGKQNTLADELWEAGSASA